MNNDGAGLTATVPKGIGRSPYPPIDPEPEPEPEPNPLLRYDTPAIFTVVEVPGSDNGTRLLLRDIYGIEINRSVSLGPVSTTMWPSGGMFQYQRLQELLRRKNNKIDQQDGQLQILKDILKAQGIRIVTAEQAEALGLG